ncbi:MAG: 50S ribosomal protein L11 methyltransferase [Candidatus Woesearchaeota archaeon]
MLALKTELKNAETIKKYLIEKNLLQRNIKPIKDENFIYFPIKNKFSFEEKNKKEIKIEFLDKEFQENKKILDYKELLTFSKEKKQALPSSYDIIGDIIIIELNGFTKNEEKEIGKALLNVNKNTKTILKKAGFFSGEFRTRKLSYVYGERKKETIYKENNVSIKLDVEKVYFSPRLSTERKRIYEQINETKKKEKILVMFSGSGIYPIVISKNTNAKLIYAIEKNPIAHKYAIENQKINKTKNIIFINGDVKKEIPKLKKKIKFDRILMPLPKGAESFLDLAFSVSKKNTIIHFYDFEHENEINNAEEKIKKIAKKKIFYKIKDIVKCGQYSPGKFRICVDFVITKIKK